jgi:ABC-2 type transport system ATP-binding protein
MSIMTEAARANGGEDIPAVRVKGLVKRYDDVLAVDGITFEVPKGQVFAFLGPNGAGKTTTVEILECLRKPTAGDAEVLGLDVRRKAKEIRKLVGVLPQEFNTYERLTVKENIEYFGSMYSRSLDADELIAVVGLEDKRDALFMNLSGGQKQKLGVAIALVNDPELVFLDEPSSGLDPKARRDIWEAIRALKERGRTVFLTTHYMEEAEVLADRVGIISKGRIVAMGSPDELIRGHGAATRLIIKSPSPNAKDVLCGADGCSVKESNGDIEVTLGSKGALPGLITRMDRAGVTYGELTLKRATLEDVFLNLTGEELGRE